MSPRDNIDVIEAGTSDSKNEKGQLEQEMSKEKSKVPSYNFKEVFIYLLFLYNQFRTFAKKSF